MYTCIPLSRSLTPRSNKQTVAERERAPFVEGWLKDVLLLSLTGLTVNYLLAPLSYPSLLGCPGCTRHVIPQELSPLASPPLKAPDDMCGGRGEGERRSVGQVNFDLAVEEKRLAAEAAGDGKMREGGYLYLALFLVSRHRSFNPFLLFFCRLLCAFKFDSMGGRGRQKKTSDHRREREREGDFPSSSFFFFLPDHRRRPNQSESHPLPFFPSSSSGVSCCARLCSCCFHGCLDM